MADIIQQIFCDPPIAIARLGGSTTPQVAYTWSQPPNPRSDGETVILPDWSLDVLTDGSVNPFLPDTIRLRDGNLIRPVCPFVEVWARLGEPGSAPASWREAPLTPELLARFGAGEAALSFEVEARNSKVERRTMNPALAFGTFPKLVIAGTNHDPVAINAVSPPGVPRRMIPTGRFIRLGALQVMRSRPQPPSGARPWPDRVRVDVIRFRFTPAAGLAYGPPQAAQPTNASPVPAVRPENAFLNANAGWFNADGQANPFVVPGDTFDESRAGTGVSLGVIDDTCEARIDVVLSLPGPAPRVLRTHANVFSGPPDYAPDRRPFLSLADELNDRAGDAASRSAALGGTDLDLWVQDLFERAYECVSLMNVDFWRAQRGLSNMAPARLRAALPNDAVTPANQAMGSRDRLRNPDLRVAAPTSDEPLPLSQHARERHRTIADVQRLRDFVRQNPDRLRALIRGPFETEQDERNTGDTTMRMPPFMRQSNADPLTVAAWQYELLMRWAQQVSTQPAIPGAALPPRAIAEPEGLAARAAARRDAVLRRLS